MATLHVRNVPDDLYELLRERAAANDRSIGAETVQLLYERLALPGSGAPPFRLAFPGRRRRPAGPGLFTRFTPRARQAVAGAQEQARELGHDHVGTDHLLLGVLLQDGAPVAAVLLEAGLELASAREAVERARGRADAERTGQIPFEPGAKQALELALRECVKLGHTAIGCEHLVLGVLDQETGPGAAILRQLAPDEEELRAKLLRSSPLERGPFVVQRPFRVLLLEGEATDWEKQLNDAAQLGYELVEIVDRRAVLRLG